MFQHLLETLYNPTHSSCTSYDSVTVQVPALHKRNPPAITPKLSTLCATAKTSFFHAYSSHQSLMLLMQFKTMKLCSLCTSPKVTFIQFYLKSKIYLSCITCSFIILFTVIDCMVLCIPLIYPIRSVWAV